tara:strand:+ start:403 stop:978 length:576 start_codon:yes stop_codon:yes gene_type:complete
MSFNLQDYTTVAERIKIFWELNPEGAITTDLIDFANQRFIVKARLYRNAVDLRPFATGYAHEIVAERGVNRDFALENCETSAVGIACKNAGIGTDKHSISREEAQKVERVNAAPPVAPENDWEGFIGSPQTTDNPDIETCEHGMMILKEGKRKADGLSYYGYTCPAPVVHLQCPARWYKLNADGKWMPKNG